jgi:thiol:disulfide interchange protein
LKLKKLFKANIKLFAQAKLDKFVKEGLIGALKEEKKSKVYRKRLNILGKEHIKLIYFFIANV